MEECRQLYTEAQHRLEATLTDFCHATWDQLLCWPPTRPGHIVHLPCPPLKGIDPTQFAERRCLDSGLWEGPSPDVTDTAMLDDPATSQGWTNYTECFLPEIRDLMKQLDSGTRQDAENKLMVAHVTRVLELTGLSISLISLMISLFIFTYFRSLQNHRTRIHKNLFAAIGIQVIIRMTLYMDQAVFDSEQVGGQQQQQRIANGQGIVDSVSSVDQLQTGASGIHETPVLCEWFYIVLEYARTTMFVWMFIEGLFLHNLITVMVFRPDTYHKLYLVLGWGIPVILTAIWAAFTATQPTSKCWWGYSFTPSYWFLEGPRLTIILINLLYLLNILRVLVTKLRNSQCSEAEQLRKAVKAAMVLLPLLGITNALVMIKAPLHRSTAEFALWCYTSHFLSSFQGFFVALLYCFLNGEVRSTLGKKLRNYLTDRQIGTSFLGFGPGSSRLISQFANPSTQVETEREPQVADHHLPHPSSSSGGSAAEKHPRHLLRASSAQQQQATADSFDGSTVATTLV